MVAQDDLCRVAALLVDHRNLYVAQQTDEHEDEREVEVRRLETLHDLRRDAVHDVADERDGGGDGDGLVDEREVVAHGVLARRLARLVHAQHVVASLGKRHEQREQEGHDDNPIAQRQLAGETSCQYAQHKSEGYYTHVEYGKLLQLGAIGKVEHIVEHDDCHDLTHHFGGEQEQYTHTEAERQNHEYIAHAYADFARSYRTQALDGMMAVGIYIDNVVVAVYRRGYQTEGEERQHSEPHAVQVEQFATKKHRDKDEEVLYPLLRARKAQDAVYHIC